MKSNLQPSIKKGLKYLNSVQRPDGSFESFSSPTRTPFVPEITYHTVFVPALMLSSLAKIEEALPIRMQLAAWLLAQKSAHWSFNYWAKSADEHKTLPYPDDLDDTFCALLALCEHDPAIIDPSCLGNMVKILIAAEQQVGGPYRTWLANKNAPAEWKDIDVAVNSNVACFLNKVAQPPPALVTLMEQAIHTGTYTSPYYPTPYPLFFYIARAYDGPLSGKLAAHILSLRRNGWWGSPLKTALAILALTALGANKNLHTAIEQLRETQLSDGSWPAEAFCIDPAIQGKRHYNGAAALTTAFALSALASEQQSPTAKTVNRTDKMADKIHNNIWEVINNDLKNLAPELRAQSLAILGRVRSSDANRQISLQAYLLNGSLLPSQQTTSTELLTQLGAANLYGWAAYTVYDDFLDNSPRPEQLSAANFALRQSVRYFERTASRDDFKNLVWSTFEQIDTANAWEMKHCRLQVTKTSFLLGRLPAYSKSLGLADRSLGHTLPAMGVLSASGLTMDDRKVKNVHLALRHYLAARQLNDDLHDWEEDLRAGIVTYVVALLFQGTGFKPGRYTFAKVIPTLQKQLWRGQTLQQVCQTITKHTTLARKAVTASQLFASPNIISRLADSIDESVQETLAEQSKAEEFLASFGTK